MHLRAHRCHHQPSQTQDRLWCVGVGVSWPPSSVRVCVYTHTHAETRTDACLCTIAVVKVVAEHHRKSDIYPANTTLNRKPAVTELELNKPARMIACLYTKVSPRRPEGVVLASGHGQKNKLVNWLSLVLWGTPKDMQRAWWAWDEQRCMEN